MNFYAFIGNLKLQKCTYCTYYAKNIQNVRSVELIMIFSGRNKFLLRFHLFN